MCIHGPPDGHGYCGNPAHLEIRYSLTAGRIEGSAETVTTEQARADTGLCGPEGLLFERKGWMAKLSVHTLSFLTLWAVLAIVAFLSWALIMLRQATV